MKKGRAFLTIAMIAAVMVFAAGCSVNFNFQLPGSSQGTQSQDKAPAADSNDVSDPAEKALKAVVPPEDFDPVGEYQDETSQRAMMTITPEGEEDHYTVEISWGSSAFETTIWEFEGDFSYDSGMLTYENCAKYELTVDDKGKQQEKTVYKDGKGALLYYEGGFHWDDKKENAGEECHFIKVDDLSDTIIEEDDEEADA